jgi:hypothetical protein
MKRNGASLFVLLFFIIAATTAAVAYSDSTVTSAPRDVLANGAHLSSSSNYVVNSTFGQPVIGQGSSMDYDVCEGFWCYYWPLYRVILTMISR